MADISTYLSTRVKGVLPSYKIGRYLIMPRAKGKRYDVAVEHRERIKELREIMIDEIKSHGIKPRDVNKNNLFYDPEEDILYLVDYHLFKRA